MGCQVFLHGNKDGYGSEILTIDTACLREYFYITIFLVIHIMPPALGMAMNNLYNTSTLDVVTC